MLDASFYLYLSFVLCSLCCYVLSHSSHSNLFLLAPCLKEKNGLFSLPFWYQTAPLVFLCHNVLQYEHYFFTLLRLSFPLSHWHFLVLFFRPFSFFSLSLFSLHPWGALRVKVAWRCPSWRHHPTVNEWVCHTANNLHSSCLICLGLRSSSHDTRAERVCLGPWQGQGLRLREIARGLKAYLASWRWI